MMPMHVAVAEALPRKTFNYRWRELDGKHRCVCQDAEAHIEQHRVRVVVDEGVPGEPRQTKLVGISDADREIAEISDQDCWPYDRAIALHSEQIDSSCGRESSGRKTDAAEGCDADPHAPRLSIAKVRRGGPTLHEAKVSGVTARHEDGDQDCAPNCN